MAESKEAMHERWRQAFEDAARLANATQCGPDSPAILAITQPVFEEVLAYVQSADAAERARMLGYFLDMPECVTQLYVIGLGFLNAR